VLAHPFILLANVFAEGLVCMVIVKKDDDDQPKRKRPSGLIPHHERQANAEQHVPEYSHLHVALSSNLIQKPTFFSPTVFPIMCAFQNTAKTKPQPSPMRPALSNSLKTGWLQLGLVVASNGMIQRSGVEHVAFVPRVELDNETA
jgi:hypothetical protein